MIQHRIKQHRIKRTDQEWFDLINAIYNGACRCG